MWCVDKLEFVVACWYVGKQLTLNRNIRELSMFDNCYIDLKYCNFIYYIYYYYYYFLTKSNSATEVVTTLL